MGEYETLWWYNGLILLKCGVILICDESKNIVLLLFCFHIGLVNQTKPGNFSFRIDIKLSETDLESKS